MKPGTAIVLFSSVVAASACKESKSVPAPKAVDPPAAATPAKPAPEVAAPAKAGMPEMSATKLGPFDLKATSVDLATLFPGATPAPPRRCRVVGGQQVDMIEVDYISVEKDGAVGARVAIDVLVNLRSGRRRLAQGRAG